MAINQQQYLHSTQFATAPAPAMSASAKSASASAQRYFLEKYGMLFGLEMLRKAGWLPRIAYKNATKWRNHSRTPQIKLYIVIIDIRFFVIRGTYSIGSHGPSIYDVENKRMVYLQHHTIVGVRHYTAYGVNTDTWCVELLHGSPHPIVEDMPEPLPLLSPTELEIQQQEINQEIGRLNERIRQLTHEADRNKLAEIALMCIP
jgi:hypothetical protein